MAGLLSGLSGLGLGELEGASLYEEHKNEKVTDEHGVIKQEIVLEEKDFLFDRSYTCPVCSKKITAKSVRSGKVKLLKNDDDLRAVYEGIDIYKYDAVVCPYCGYGALTRYFQPLLDAQVRLVKENICGKLKWTPPTGETYSYEEALKHYQIVLACAIVKRARNSEKAYICLKAAWLLRGWQEELATTATGEETKAKIVELKAQEEEYLKNALEGFLNARMTEVPPICGMDNITLDYMLAEIHYRFKEYDEAYKMISGILISPNAAKRIKDKAFELKESIIRERKKGVQ